MAEASPSRGADWSEREVERTVADYFDMLRAEMLGQSYNKAEHRRLLLATLAGRSEQAVEFKHATISAVLVHMGLPYIDGYKPMGHYQTLLAQEVTDYLAEYPDCLERLLRTAQLMSQANHRQRAENRPNHRRRL